MTLSCLLFHWMHQLLPPSVLTTVSSSHLGFGHGHWYGTNTWSHSANSRPCKCTFPPWPERLCPWLGQLLHQNLCMEIPGKLFAHSDPHKVQWTSEPISFSYTLHLHICYSFHILFILDLGIQLCRSEPVVAEILWRPKRLKPTRKMMWNNRLLALLISMLRL